MKKLTLTSLSLLLVVCSYAQEISGGVKGGLNVSSQKVDWAYGQINTQPKLGVHIGGYLVVMLDEKMGIQPELLLSTQGAKYKDFDGKTNMTYILVPVLFRYNFNEMFSAHAGPQFGLLLSAKAVSDGDKIDRKDDFKTLDVGAAIGVGVELPMGFNCGARYIFGLSQISKDVDGYGKFKSSLFQLFIAYRLFGGE